MLSDEYEVSLLDISYIIEEQNDDKKIFQFG